MKYNFNELNSVCIRDGKKIPLYAVASAIKLSNVEIEHVTITAKKEFRAYCFVSYGFNWRDQPEKTITVNVVGKTFKYYFEKSLSLDEPILYSDLKDALLNAIKANRNMPAIYASSHKPHARTKDIIKSISKANLLRVYKKATQEGVNK